MSNMSVKMSNHYIIVSADPFGVIRRVGALCGLFTPPVVLPLEPAKPHLAPMPPRAGSPSKVSNYIFLEYDPEFR